MEGITGMTAIRETSEAFESAVAPHYGGLVRRLTAVLRDPEAGEDLAQETYLRAFRAWRRFDGTDARAWLHTIGLRLAFNERGRRSRRPAGPGRRAGWGRDLLDRGAAVERDPRRMIGP